MNKFKCIYPNPFEQRGVEEDFDLDEILEEACETLEPFFEDKYCLLLQDIDEFGYLRIDKRFVKILQDSILQTSDYFKEKLKKKIPFLYNYVKKKYFYLTAFQNYNENLRFLDLPVHCSVDKYGFETQLLSNEIFEDAIDDIDDGFTFIYDYAADNLPETIDSWNEYVLYTTYSDFPNIHHDEILDSLYESFDIIFANLRKNFSILSSSLFTNDISTRMIKVITPRIKMGVVARRYRLLWIISIVTFILLCLSITKAAKKIRKMNWSKVLPKDWKAWASYIQDTIEDNDGLVPEIKERLLVVDVNTLDVRCNLIVKIQHARTKLSLLKTEVKYSLLKLMVGD